MLKSLYIENIAVIERACVEFAGGLSVLTGETGAGKSIMIDALNAVLGNRTSRDLVRTGAEKATVTASFESDKADSWCQENEIDTENGEIVLQRRLTPDGRSSARVNGVPVSASQLKALGGLLLDIHGQNDGRQLLDEKRHLDYLDRFGVDPVILGRYTEAYMNYRAVRREMDKLRMDESQKMQLEDTLRARIDELEKAQIRPGEEAELTERRDLLRNAEKLKEFMETAYNALYEGEENAVSLSGDAEYALERAGAWQADFLKMASSVKDARLLLEDVAEQLRDKQTELDFSPEEYDQLEERLNKLRRLEKKYACDEEGLSDILSESRQKLEDLEYADDRLQKLEREEQRLLQTAKNTAAELTKARRAAAKRLEKQVEAELRDLSMPSVRFCVLMERREGDDELEKTGMDDIRFVMSANAGEALGPISRIASGGELSRIMLALKNVFAEKDQVESLIFDEIDTGVSGIAAQRVAEKLASLAKNKQVLCVTHLPQIAAMAQNQYLVEKREENGRTFTEIRLLDREGRRLELARLNGGDHLTDTLLAGAEEMLENAQKYRSSL